MENGIDVEDDEAVRRRGPYPEFRWRECSGYTRPHKKGTTHRAWKKEPGLLAGHIAAPILSVGYSFPDQAPTNVLIINAVDPKAGTAELKARAVKIAKA